MASTIEIASREDCVAAVVAGVIVGQMARASVIDGGRIRSGLGFT